MPGPPQEQSGRNVTAFTWRNAALAKRQPTHAFEPDEIFPVPYPVARSPGALSRLHWAAEAAGCGTSMGAGSPASPCSTTEFRSCSFHSIHSHPMTSLGRFVRVRTRTKRRRRPRLTTGRTLSVLRPPTAPSARSGPGAGGTSEGRRRHAVPAARTRPADPFGSDGRRSMRPGAGHAYLPMA